MGEVGDTRRNFSEQVVCCMRDLRGYGDVLRWLARCVGTTLHDESTGEVLGRAFLWKWAGRIYVIGYTGTAALKLVPVCRKDVRYWVFGIGFARADEPDFSRVVEEEKS